MKTQPNQAERLMRVLQALFVAQARDAATKVRPDRDAPDMSPWVKIMARAVQPVMLDLTQRGRDVRAFVAALEAWIIDALAAFNVTGELREGRVGVWVERKGAGWSREDKIAAIGVKLRRWVSFHGISLNVEPDLSHFSGIVPCGQTEHGVTSLVDLGLPVAMDEADAALRSSFAKIFGPVEDAEAPV